MKAYILSGGKSSRMGEDKGLKLINGQPIISLLLNTLQKIGMETSIIANDEGYKIFGVEVIPDIVSEKGPLGGIFTALTYAKGEDILVLSVDTPFISSENIELLVGKHCKNQIAVVYSHGRIFPLFAVYPASVKEFIANRIESNELKLMKFLDENEHNKVELNLRPEEEMNVNTSEDFAEAENYLNYGN